MNKENLSINLVHDIGLLEGRGAPDGVQFLRDVSGVTQQDSQGPLGCVDPLLSHQPIWRLNKDFKNQIKFSRNQGGKI